MACPRDSGALCRYLSCYRSILRTMVREMSDAELSASISQSFIVQMIPHHRAAIRMSENLLRYGPGAPLREIAENIIREQSRSIRSMSAALKACSMLYNTKAEQERYLRRYREIACNMFSQMRLACVSGSISGDFMREMIPHHQGAIRMSENALSFPICPELTPLLREIIVSQRAGVQKMQRLLAQC